MSTTLLPFVSFLFRKKALNWSREAVSAAGERGKEGVGG
jgi:hypothetical protein